MDYGFQEAAEFDAQVTAANELMDQRMQAFRNCNAAGEDDAAIASILGANKRAALQAHASNATSMPIPDPPSLTADVRFRVQRREWERREGIIYSSATFTHSPTLKSWSTARMYDFQHTTIFNHDKPSQIIPEKDSISYVKSYFQGP